MAVGVGFDDGEQFGVRRGEAREKAKVFLESASANLNPAGRVVMGDGKEQLRHLKRNVVRSGRVEQSTHFS